MSPTGCGLIAACRPPRARRRNDRPPSSARPPLKTDPAATTREQEGLAAFLIQHVDHDDRAVKASPTGGLRPALTALHAHHPALEAVPPRVPLRLHAPPAADKRPESSRPGGRHSLDKTRSFRNAVPGRGRGAPRWEGDAPPGEVYDWTRWCRTGCNRHRARSLGLPGSGPGPKSRAVRKSCVVLRSRRDVSRHHQLVMASRRLRDSAEVVRAVPGLVVPECERHAIPIDRRFGLMDRAP